MELQDIGKLLTDPFLYLFVAWVVLFIRKRVSRRHAEIAPTPNGYVVIDTSTNGTFVNGERIQGLREMLYDIKRVSAALSEVAPQSEEAELLAKTYHNMLRRFADV